MGSGGVSPWQKHYHSDANSIKRGEVTITRRGSRVLVAAPYDERFRLGAHAIVGARWKRSIRVWSFPITECFEVCKLINEVFGGNWIPAWLSEMGGGEKV